VCLQMHLILAATTFEAVDDAVLSLTSLRDRRPSSKPHLLALGIIPILQPHLRWLAGSPPAAEAERQPPAPNAQSAQGRPSAPSNSPPAAPPEGSLAALREGVLPLQLAACDLPGAQKVDYAVSIACLWAVILCGEQLDAACWRESLRGVQQLLSDTATLFQLAAIDRAAQEHGMEDDGVAFVTAAAHVFQQMAGACNRCHFPADGDDDVHALWVETHLRLTRALNGEEALPYLVELVCGQGVSTQGTLALRCRAACLHVPSWRSTLFMFQ
jgi:hypothetical protein